MGWVVQSTSRLLYHRDRNPVHIVQEGGWAPVPLWKGAENLAPLLPRFDLRTVQSVASRYTGSAIPAGIVSDTPC